MARPESSWWQDPAKLKFRTEVYRDRVVHGMTTSQLAERYDLTTGHVSMVISEYYQWLKNGARRDKPRRTCTRYKRPTSVVGIGYMDIPHLKAAELAHRASLQGYDTTTIMEGLASVGIVLSRPAVNAMIRQLDRSERRFGKPINFKILRDDLVKAGVAGYGREYYFG